MMVPGRMYEELAKENNELMLYLEELTPGGSEFHNSPKNCFEWVKSRLANQAKIAKERNELRAENTRLTAENRELMIENSSLIKMTGADGLEIDRLTEQLQAVSDQLTEAVQRAQEAEEELGQARGELGQWRNAFTWVEQHVTNIHVGFVNENPVRVNWIDDNGNDREGKCEALLDLVQEQLRLAER